MRVGSVSTYTTNYQNEQIKELKSPSSTVLKQSIGEKSLIITGRLISESFRELCELTELEELDLSQADIPASEFDKIQSLGKLKVLKLPLDLLKEISHDPISSPLRQLHERGVSIEILDSHQCSHCRLRIFESMRYIKKVCLKNLVVEGWMISTYFKRLCQITELENLDLRQADIREIDKFNQIENLENLKVLKVSLKQLYEMSCDSPGSTLIKLCQKGVSVEIDYSEKLDLREPPIKPQTVTDLFAYAKETKNFFIEKILTEQLTVDHFEEEDLEGIYALTVFKELSLRSVLLPFNGKEKIISSFDVLFHIVHNNLQLENLDIASKGPDPFIYLDQEAIKKIGKIKSLKSLKFEFSPSREKNFDFTSLLDLPHLKKLTVPSTWLENDAINPGNFLDLLKQRGVQIDYST